MDAARSSTTASSPTVSGAQPARAMRVSRTITPAATSVDVPGVTPFITPTADFYRIDTALTVPRVGVEDWTLSVTGYVDRPLSIGYEELLERPMVESVATIACVSNEIGGDLIGTARWLGCRLDDLLAEAGIQPRADQVVGVSVDGFTAGFPTEVLDGRDALVVVGMNGEPLPTDHGFPARLVVPGLYGYVSATKWLEEIRLTRFDEFEGYWIPRGWSAEGPVKTQSRIDTPRAGSTVDAGAPRAIAGVAWAPLKAITRVEVQVDDGPWQDAELGEEYSSTTWRQWKLAWTPEAGDHTIRVRATDGTGETQTSEVTDVAPDGATGWHTIEVRAE
jgi:DMSO/TMAO reductase YedYZ molybdopterin-dependent catalytic subunit